jgi:hypothetical protein
MKHSPRHHHHPSRPVSFAGASAAGRISASVLLGLACLAGLRGEAQPLASLAKEDGRSASPPIRFVKDPINEEVQTFRHDVRQLYNASKFGELEKIAKELLSGKAKFGNGSWKIVQFYDALECRPDEPESMWRLHDRIHRDWIAKYPESATARLAHADFLRSYAWHARGNGYASSVSAENGQIFIERLASAQAIIDEAQKLKEKNPFWGVIALTIAMGGGAEKREFDLIVRDAHAGEPLFWGYFTKRAQSLLPRWHGAPGEWEDFAMKSAALPDGLGAELYARIVLALDGYYGNIFEESDASWPKTREGLEMMLKRYPASLEIANEAARLATMARDRQLAKAMFDRLGGVCVLSAWNGPEQYLGALKWLQKSERDQAGQ